MRRFVAILMMLMSWALLLGCDPSHDHTTMGWYVVHELHDLEHCEPVVEDDVVSSSARADLVTREGVRQVLNRGYLLAR